ncbi:dihydrodipicolinate synthase family protein [Candidatus Vidania fulgoroideorum]
MKNRTNILALVTPMKLNGSVDYISFQNLLSVYKKSIDTVLISGTTGECSTLSLYEKLCLINHARKRFKNIMVGCSYHSTKQSITFLRKARSMGVTRCLLTPPYYNTNSDRDVVAYYHYIATRANIKITIYDIPSRTGKELGIQTLRKLSNIPNVDSIKESSGNLRRQLDITKGTKLHLYSGDDSTCALSCILGSYGIISVISHLFPDLVNHMINNQSIYIQNSLFNLNKLLLSPDYPNPSSVKWLMYKNNLIHSPHVRSPLQQPTQSHKSILIKEYMHITKWKTYALC